MGAPLPPVPPVPNGYPLDGDTHVLEPLKIWRASALAGDVEEEPTFAEARGFTARLDRAILARLETTE